MPIRISSLMSNASFIGWVTPSLLAAALGAGEAVDVTIVESAVVMTDVSAAVVSVEPVSAVAVSVAVATVAAAAAAAAAIVVTVGAAVAVAAADGEGGFTAAAAVTLVAALTYLNQDKAVGYRHCQSW